MGGEICVSATISLNLALAVWVVRHALAVSIPGMTQYASYRGLGEPEERSGRVRKISPPYWDSIPGPSSL